VDWINLFQDRGKWPVYIKPVIKRRVLQNAEYLLSSEE
jgi:hypothetical protein